MKHSPTVIKRKLRLIDQTIEYYKTHNRGVKPSGACVYSTGTGKDNVRCAIGRLVTSHQARALQAVGGSLRYLYEDSYQPFNRNKQSAKALQQLVHTYGLEFLQCLQGIHDNLFYWEQIDPVGVQLTEVGKQAVKDFKAAVKASLV